MFYSAQILSKKGALGTIWIASHMEKRLKRNAVFETNIPATCDSVLNPEAPLALRLSGQLLLGIVRVYLRKLQYLEHDASHALEGLRKNVAGGHSVDLPDGGTAPEGAITLPDADPLAMFAGVELFPNFEANLLQGAGVTFQPRSFSHESLTLVDDISELFGSRWTPEEERFEAAGGDLDRRFSIELERLRSQAAVAAAPGQLFFQSGGDEAFPPVPEDEVMAVPPEDVFAMLPAATPGRTPVSAVGGAAPLPGLSDIRITPRSMLGQGAETVLPDIGAPSATFTSGGGASFGGGSSMRAVLQLQQQQPEEQHGPAAAAQQQRRQPALRKRRVRPQLDMDEGGRPATTLPSDQIRALLANRAPLLCARGLQARTQPLQLPPGRYDVVAQSEEARESALFRPNAFTALGPELLAMYQRAMHLPEGVASPAPQRNRRRSDAAEGAAAAAVQTEQQQQQQETLGSPSVGFTSGGAASSMGGADDYTLPPAGPEDWIEAPDSQQQQQLEARFEDQAGYPAGPEEEAAAPLPPASEQRGMLALHPVAGVPAVLGSVDVEGSEGSGLPSARDGFTARTRLVLEHVQRAFAPASGSKRRHPSSGDLAARELSLGDLVAGKTRLDACRWFFEALVLKGKGYVELEQWEPYGDIAILPRDPLAAPAAAAGPSL